MRVHHLNCGTMRPCGGRLVDGNPGVRRRAELACHCLLVETEHGLVLVETGFGTQAVIRPREWLGKEFLALLGPDLAAEQTAVARVRALGHRPEDVRHIVLTHLDLDHAGGLADFPDATVHLHATELRALRTPRDRAERHRYRRVQFEHGPKFRDYRADGEPWFGFSAVRQLDGLGPEVLIVPLAGHTRGHAGVAVDTGSGWLLHAGDSYYSRGRLDPLSPHAPIGVRVFETLAQTEKRDRLANQQRLRELVDRHSDAVTVFSAHDMPEFERMAGPAA